jgi:hypothetical protein
MAQENRLWGANVFAVNCSNSASPSPSVQFRNISGALVLPSPPRKPGRPSPRITPRTSGHVTSCPSSTFGFVRSLFFIVELASRRIVHFGVTRSPTDEWVVQQLREATPFGQAPRFLIRDRDSKYGECFTRVAVGTSIEVLKTPYCAPKANAVCERFLGSVLRECLDHAGRGGETSVSHCERVRGLP